MLTTAARPAQSKSSSSSSASNSSAMVLRVGPGTGREKLPDNDQWTSRFAIRSESSDRKYIIAQNKAKGHFACDCPGWRTRRSCKHILAIGLLPYEQPMTIKIDGDK